MTIPRRIAVWVSETDHSEFRWDISVLRGGRLFNLRGATCSFLTFEGALDEGTSALKRLLAEIDGEWAAAEDIKAFDAGSSPRALQLLRDAMRRPIR